MRARDFWRTVTVDRADLLAQVLSALRADGARFCVVGGQGVNAYAEPVVSLDLDLAIAGADLKRLLPSLPPHIHVEHFAHSINLSAPDTELRIQFQTDSRYEDFVGRAQQHDVLGERLPVARIDDVLQGKVWAALDGTRRPSKRQKDLADISRLLEVAPSLRAQVPREILDRLL